MGSIEIKLGGEKLIEEGAASLIKLKEMFNEDNLTFQMILTTSGPSYRRKDGIYVVPIDCLIRLRERNIILTSR